MINVIPFKKSWVTITFSLLVLRNRVSATQSTEDSRGDYTALQTQLLEALQRQTLHELRRANWSVVQQDDYPWIVALRPTHRHQWAAAARRLRGSVKYGISDDDLADYLKETLGIEDEDILVYPAGDKTAQNGEPMQVSNLREAAAAAVRTIADEVPRLKRETISELVVEAIESEPSAFPVLVIAGNNDMPANLRALIPHLSRYFRFGLIANAPEEILEEMDIDVSSLTYPGMLVLAVSQGIDKKEANALFHAVPYKGNEDESWSYPHLLKYFLDINRQYRPEFVGKSLAKSKDVLEMTDVVESELHRLLFQVRSTESFHATDEL